MFFSREIFTYNSLALEVKLILPFLAAPELPGFSWSPGISIMLAKASAARGSRGIMWGLFVLSPWLGHSPAGSAQPVHCTPFCTSAPATVCHTPHTHPRSAELPRLPTTPSIPRWELLASLTLDSILQRRFLHLFKAPSHIWAQAGKESR